MRESLVTGIDHVIVAVRDLDRAVAAYRQLGFTPTDRGRHPVLGTQNHLFMFGRDYFELVGVERATAENQRWRDVLADREGLAGIALATDDAEAATVELRARGVTAPDVSYFSRPVEIDGRMEEARFAAAYVAAEVTPVAPMFFCQHFTRELVWRPEWQRHPNGVTGLGAVVALAADPASTASAYAPLVGEGGVRGHTVILGDRPMLLGSADLVTAWGAGVSPGAGAADPRLTGVALRVGDLDATRRFLERSGVPYARGGNAIVVGPDFACGAVIKFVG